MFLTIISRSVLGLGNAKPINLIVLPVLFENDVKAVIELASFDDIQRNAPRLP